MKKSEKLTSRSSNSTETQTMSLVHINWNPESRQLKQFGWLSLVLLPLVAWIWGATLPWIGIVAGIGGLLALLGSISPAFLKPIFVGLSLVLMPIGLVVGEVMLVLIFFLIFLPMGLVFRMMGRDRLQRKLDRSATTYWQKKASPDKLERYFRQY